jgi:hypothetical protein
MIFSTQHRHAKMVLGTKYKLCRMQLVGGRAVHFAFASTLTVGGRKWCDWVPGPASFGENH